jgi:hypothetical protein
MNKRLILYLTLVVTLLECILLYLLWYCFDHSIAAKPPSITQLAMGHALQVLAFPMTAAAVWSAKDPTPFAFVSIIFYAVSALAWAVVFERLLWLFRRSSSRH